MKVIVWNVNRATESRCSTSHRQHGNAVPRRIRRHGLVPTFQHTSGHVEHQLDYCYLNAPMLQRLNRAGVPGHEQVFGPTPRLSDHLPIVCEFD